MEKIISEMRSLNTQLKNLRSDIKNSKKVLKALAKLDELMQRLVISQSLVTRLPNAELKVNKLN